ncbi:hypothetical protein [Parabacteroides goldsteinii]|uniref:Uncharacterized protein n=1 Tax=Parabacteroides goldsteinii TaxID=328812 RepID=A0A6G1ZL58_9BACT|nr:hypothetical protein [Parabacteroides goldsteinii]MRX94385.1 hypothetical protein [Parabacteroides goldsteinii]MRY00036.1 hypothetical protein [Parabacteroides goldsteinii]MRY05326.1 hypothetical protein [Parabacteroides goldsteinii]MRY14696.1 hypothetical protein [Parabacteroides goldsteinii]MRY23966.1 hypothetical protein [Parabacteroides goldsteinii]
MKFYNQERETSEIQIHDVDEYEYPYLYTHNLSNLYAYPIINHGDEWYRDASCIPYDNTAFCIENEVVKKHSGDELGILLHYLTGDRFCSIYGYVNTSLYSPSNCNKLVFFKGFALDCIIHIYPEAVGAFTIVVPEIGATKREFSFTYIITDKPSSKSYCPLNYLTDIYGGYSIPKSVTDIRRTDIILYILSAMLGYSIADLTSNFDWNKLLNQHVKSKLEQAVFNYIYPQNFQSPYSEEEICYSEFVNNFICIANVNAYNYRMDADTINKNYIRFFNIMDTFPTFLNKVPSLHYSHLSRALYFTAYHFDDVRVNDRLFILAYNMLNRAFETTRMIYFSFLRCSLIEERYTSAISMISKLYPQLPLEEIEEKVGEIQLADYLLVEKYIPNYISPKDDIAIRCNQIIDNLFYYYDIDDVYTQVSDVQKIINHRLSLFANSSDFLNRKNQI